MTDETLALKRNENGKRTWADTLRLTVFLVAGFVRASNRNIVWDKALVDKTYDLSQPGRKSITR